MLNTTNYFTNNSSGPKVTATVTITKNLQPAAVQVSYSSVGLDFKNIFNNNTTVLNNIITSIHESNSGAYFSNNSEHIRKDVHYNG